MTCNKLSFTGAPPAAGIFLRHESNIVGVQAHGKTLAFHHGAHVLIRRKPGGTLVRTEPVNSRLEHRRRDLRFLEIKPDLSVIAGRRSGQGGLECFP